LNSFNQILIDNLAILEPGNPPSYALRGPLSTFIPRISPGKSIAGVYVAAGIIVGSQTYTAGRDEMVFPDLLEFKPDRWENPTEQMKSMDRPFSPGPHVCIGMHVARLEMLLNACALHQAFDAELAVGFRHEGMKLGDQGFMMAEGKSLLVKLTPVT
jgi:cytochrome P450